MKALGALILASMLVSVSFLVSSIRVYGEPSVGVKKGDWIEYNINITGAPPPIHNVTWMRMEILQVQGTALKANLTNKIR